MIDSSSPAQASNSRCDASRLNIVIPVYNEGANFPALWRALSASVRTRFRSMVIHDFDEDDTVPVVRRLIEHGERRLSLIKNQVRPGVVGAILTGVQRVEWGPVIVVMGDLSDDLTRIDEMVELYQRGYDVVVGSRYMRGGRIRNGPFVKQALSRIGGVSLYWLRRIPTHDATNAFKLYDAAMLRSMHIESRGGFELNLEIGDRAFCHLNTL